jgi:hypothetical protein
VKFETRLLLGFLLGLVIDLYSHLYLYPLLGISHSNKLIRYVLSISTVIIVGMVIWKLTANLSKERSNCVIKGGLIGALAGFLIGFVGPILLQPGLPQGPLLGIFFTLPLGFVFGLIVGFFYPTGKYRSS